MLGRVLDAAAKQLQASDVELPERTAHWLWQHASGHSTHELLLSLRQEVDAETLARFDAFVARRANREPLQYIVGRTDFCGLSLLTDARALIPRPETQMLVAAAEEHIAARLAKRSLDVYGPLVVCDVGTGSGAIAVALAKRLQAAGLTPSCRIIGVDDAMPALSLAAQNAARCEVQDVIEWRQSDLISGLPDALRVDVLLANLPYIPEGERPDLQPEVVRYEPPSALFAGSDGLAVYRRLVAQLRERDALAADAWMIWEIGHEQSAAVCRLLQAAWPEATITVRQDEGGHDRFVCTRFTSLLD